MIWYDKGTKFTWTAEPGNGQQANYDSIIDGVLKKPTFDLDSGKVLESKSESVTSPNKDGITKHQTLQNLENDVTSHLRNRKAFNETHHQFIRNKHFQNSGFHNYGRKMNSVDQIGDSFNRERQRYEDRHQELLAEINKTSNHIQDNRTLNNNDINRGQTQRHPLDEVQSDEEDNLFQNYTQNPKTTAQMREPRGHASQSVSSLEQQLPPSPPSFQPFPFNQKDDPNGLQKYQSSEEFKNAYRTSGDMGYHSFDSSINMNNFNQSPPPPPPPGIAILANNQTNNEMLPLDTQFVIDQHEHSLQRVRQLQALMTQSAIQFEEEQKTIENIPSQDPSELFEKVEADEIEWIYQRALDTEQMIIAEFQMYQQKVTQVETRAQELIQLRSHLDVALEELQKTSDPNGQFQGRITEISKQIESVNDKIIITSEQIEQINAILEKEVDIQRNLQMEIQKMVKFQGLTNEDRVTQFNTVKTLIDQDKQFAEQQNLFERSFSNPHKFLISMQKLTEPINRTIPDKVEQIIEWQKELMSHALELGQAMDVAQRQLRVSEVRENVLQQTYRNQKSSILPEEYPPDMYTAVNKQKKISQDSVKLLSEAIEENKSRRKNAQNMLQQAQASQIWATLQQIRDPTLNIVDFRDTIVEFMRIANLPVPDKFLTNDPDFRDVMHQISELQFLPQAQNYPVASVVQKCAIAANYLENQPTISAPTLQQKYMNERIQDSYNQRSINPIGSYNDTAANHSISQQIQEKSQQPHDAFNVEKQVHQQTQLQNKEKKLIIQKQIAQEEVKKTEIELNKAVKKEQAIYLKNTREEEELKAIRYMLRQNQGDLNAPIATTNQGYTMGNITPKPLTWQQQQQIDNEKLDAILEQQRAIEHENHVRQLKLKRAQQQATHMENNLQKAQSHVHDLDQQFKLNAQQQKIADQLQHGVIDIPMNKGTDNNTFIKFALGYRNPDADHIPPPPPPKKQSVITQIPVQEISKGMMGQVGAIPWEKPVQVLVETVQSFYDPAPKSSEGIFYSDPPGATRPNINEHIYFVPMEEEKDNPVDQEYQQVEETKQDYYNKIHADRYSGKRKSKSGHDRNTYERQRKGQLDGQ